MSIRHKAGISAASGPNSNLGGPIVLVDADNTLWDTDGVFARAQLALSQAVEGATGRSSLMKTVWNTSGVSIRQ